MVSGLGACRVHWGGWVSLMWVVMVLLHLGQCQCWVGMVGGYVLSHICAMDGRVGLMPCRFCSAASCRDVMPAHTPCMSTGWYSRAFLRQGCLTGQVSQICLAVWM